MKLQSRWTFGRDRSFFTVAEAIEREITNAAGDCSGIAEDARATANEAVHFTARLVTLLHDKGVLSNEDILTLLPTFEEASDEPS